MSDPALLGVRRLLALRAFPGFESLDVADVALFAENAAEMFHGAGTTIVRAGNRLDAMHLILRGAIEAEHGPDRIDHHGDREVYGALEALAGAPSTATATAVTDTWCLEVRADDLIELLEDNFTLLHSTLRSISATVAAIVSALPEQHWPVPPSPFTTAPASPLSLVERLIFVRGSAAFAQGRLHALAALAEAAEERSWDDGEQIWADSDRATFSIIVIDGTVRAVRAGTLATAHGPGETVGSLEALGEVPRWFSAIAEGPVRALVFPAGAILDLFEDHTDLALDVVRALAQAIAALAADHDLKQLLTPEGE